MPQELQLLKGKVYASVVAGFSKEDLKLVFFENANIRLPITILSNNSTKSVYLNLNNGTISKSRGSTTHFNITGEYFEEGKIGGIKVSVRINFDNNIGQLEIID